MGPEAAMEWADDEKKRRRLGEGDPVGSGEKGMATHYRSRPHEVDAMQWTGDRAGAVALRSWMNQPSHQYGLDWGQSALSAAFLWVKKADRWIPLSVGDYVVAEPDGDGFYPCARAIFEDRYEASRSPRASEHG